MSFIRGFFSRFDIFAAHSRWNLAQVKILIPEGYTLTILRDPVDTFESFFTYMGVDRRLGVDINNFAQQFATRVGQGQVRWGWNKQLYDLGIDEHYLPDEERVREKIKQLDAEFDSVLILEHLEEGLVLLADNLCWPLEDMKSVCLNSRADQYISNISRKSRDILTAWLWPDFLLYQHFLEKHRHLTTQFGLHKMLDAVRILQSMNRDLVNECTDTKNRSNDKAFEQENKKIRHLAPQKNKSWCRPYYRTEIAYTERTRFNNKVLSQSF